MSSYVCTLTGKETMEPAVTPSGFIFDRKAIEDHISFDPTCPKTSVPLSKSDLILINSVPGQAKAPPAAKKRMIADADTAVISNSWIPEPLPLFVAALCSVGSSCVLAVAIAFRALDVALLSVLPAVCFFWGLVGAVVPAWTITALELGSASESAVAFCGAVVALASYAVLRVGSSGRSAAKMKVLPLVALVAFTASKHMDHEAMPLPLPGGTSFAHLSAAVPLLLSLAHSYAPALQEYFEKNQKAAVKMAAQVREE